MIRGPLGIRILPVTAQALGVVEFCATDHFDVWIMTSNARQSRVAAAPTPTLLQTVRLESDIDDSQFCLPTENRISVRAMARATEIN